MWGPVGAAQADPKIQVFIQIFIQISGGRAYNFYLALGTCYVLCIRSDDRVRQVEHFHCPFTKFSHLSRLCAKKGVYCAACVGWVAWEQSAVRWFRGLAAFAGAAHERPSGKLV